MKMRLFLFFCLILSILIAPKNAHNDKELQESEQQTKLVAETAAGENMAGATTQDMHVAMKRSTLEQQAQASQAASEKKLERRSLDMGQYSNMPAERTQRSSNNYLGNYWNYVKYKNDLGKTASLDKLQDLTKVSSNLFDGMKPSLKQDYKREPMKSNSLDAIFEKTPYITMKSQANFNTVPEPYDKQSNYRTYMGLPEEYDYSNKYRTNSYGVPSYEKNMQSRSFELGPYAERAPLTAMEQKETMENMGNYANAAEAEKEIKRRSAQAMSSSSYENNNLPGYEKAVNRRDLNSPAYNGNSYFTKNDNKSNLESNSNSIQRRSYGSAANANAAAASYNQQERINAKENYANLLAYAKELNRRSFNENSFDNRQKNLQRPYGNPSSETAMHSAKDIDRRSYDPNFYLKMEPFGKDSQRDRLQHSSLQKDIDRRAAMNSYDNAAKRMNANVNKELQRRYAIANSNAYMGGGPFEMAAAEGCEQKQQNPCGGGGGGGSVDVGKGDARQKSSNIAMKAAVDAKAAQEAQVPAGEAAAAQVRQQLADRAMAAAQAAEAALAGKQQIVAQLEQEVRESEAVTREQEASLLSAQSNVDASRQAANDAEKQLTTLKHAVSTAKAHVSDAEAAASGAQQSLAEKGQLLEAAKNRVEVLLRQLSVAKQDYEKTKTAAYKAVCAAAEAKSKANRMRRMLRRRHSRYLRELAHIAQEQQPLQQEQPQQQQSQQQQHQKHNN